MTELLRFPTPAGELEVGNQFAYLGMAGRVTSVTHYAATALVTYSRTCGTGTLVLPLGQEVTLLMAVADSVTEWDDWIAELPPPPVVIPSMRTRLTWKPVRHGNRLGWVETAYGTRMLPGACTLTEAGEHFLGFAIRVLAQDLTCLRHPACDLTGELCEPETMR